MHTRGRSCVGLVAALVCAASLRAAASAAVSMTVQPLVAEFNAAPGAFGRTTVTVTNNGTEAERFTARPTDWRTLADGSTTLERPGAEGVHSITRDLSLSAYQFVLQPGERREIALSLAVPSSFPGTPASYWGGFLVSAAVVTAPPSAVGIAATVFVYQNVGAPRRHLALQSLRVVQNKDGTSDLVARLRNDSPGYCRSSAHVLVEQAGRIVKDDKVTISTVFPGSTRLMTQPLGKLPPGDYRIEVAFDYGGDSILDGTTQAHVR
ncbi:MAG: hypothetical protein JWO85_2528 [Candidatus Eremiobacteraeota bacterium]|jgi:hypothetical protein|nr:hypothetical protein [Candidatus Eremiobacteraeota bacterium]